MSDTTGAVDIGAARPVTKQIFDDLGLLMSEVDYPAIDKAKEYSVPSSKYIPSRDKINSWLKRSGADAETQNAIDAIPSLDFIYTRPAAGGRDNFSYIVNTLLWGGDELVQCALPKSKSSDTASDNVFVGRGVLRQLVFSSTWNLSKAVTARELGLVHMFLKENLPSVTVGELAFTVAQDRHLFVRTALTSNHIVSAIDLQEIHEAIISEFRNLGDEHTALMWFTMVLKCYKDNIATSRYVKIEHWHKTVSGIAEAYPLNVVLPFFLSGIWDEGLIAHGIANNIDHDTLAAFGVRDI